MPTIAVKKVNTIKKCPRVPEKDIVKYKKNLASKTVSGLLIYRVSFIIRGSVSNYIHLKIFLVLTSPSNKTRSLPSTSFN